MPKLLFEAGLPGHAPEVLLPEQVPAVVAKEAGEEASREVPPAPVAAPALQRLQLDEGDGARGEGETALRGRDRATTSVTDEPHSDVLAWAAAQKAKRAS